MNVEKGRCDDCETRNEHAVNTTHTQKALHILNTHGDRVFVNGASFFVVGAYAFRRDEKPQNRNGRRAKSALGFFERN